MRRISIGTGIFNNRKTRKRIALAVVLSSAFSVSSMLAQPEDSNVSNISVISHHFMTASVAEAKKVSKQDKNKARQYYLQGIGNYRKGSIKEAARSFMEAEKLDVDNPLYELLSADCLRYLKQYPSSLRYYNEALEHNGKADKKLRSKIRMKTYTGLAMAYNEQNQTAKAVEFAKKAIEDFPEDYRGHLTLGNIYASKEATYPDAIREYKASLDVDKEQLDSYLKLAKLYNKQGNMEGIITTYKQATDYRPLDESMKMALAQVYISNKDPKNPKKHYYKEAIEVLKDLNNVNPKDARVHYYLSSLYLLTGDDINAEKELGITNGLNANLGNKLAMEIRAYRKKHAGEPKPSLEDTSVDIDSKTGETTIIINGKVDKPSVTGNTKDVITLDEEDSSLKKENPLVKKQISDMEKKKFKEFLQENLED